MNAISNIDRPVGLAVPNDLSFESWVGIGRDLAVQRRNVDWMIGDWLALGAERFEGQVEFDFLAEQLGIAPKRLKEMEKIAETFPKHLRAANVPFEVHAYVAALPAEQRAETLVRASREQWGEKQAREIVTQYRQASSMFHDEDAETRLAVEIIRAWNRAPVASRRYFWELAERTNFGAINENDPGADDDA